MTNTPTVGRPKKSKERLSKQLILQTALPIVQKQGAGALSFRVLADKLKVTPMAVTYHSGSKRKLLADLVELAFANTLQGTVEEGASAKARSILSAYYLRALPNANLLRAVLEDVTLISKDLLEITDRLRACTQELDGGDKNDVLLHLLIDYTHGFVLSASSGEDNPITIDDFLRGIDWVLARARGGAHDCSK
ncbi:TetR/AcrR family transcriptional regulator [Ruegeria arenilitoris]|uniref:TetR/AcrR family transcriptional regulator n=1 Tax=Ruegeria arenilitoris TaxID=1173585 RepID=UPI00147DCF0A|nr:TetR/AcrR family transcriptional regulator [Ruegeria arenilitoris]